MGDESKPGKTPRWLGGNDKKGGLRPRSAARVIVVVWLIAVITFGVFEHLADKQTFPTVWLGMWWALQTVTTVGYGDVVPVSSLGRAVASFLLLGGLALLSVVTATITSGFVARSQREMRNAPEDPMMQRLDALGTQLDSIEAELRLLRGPADAGV